MTVRTAPQPLNRRAFVAGATLVGVSLSACHREAAVSPEPSPTADACVSAVRKELRFLTWNVFMMPPWTGESPRNTLRAAMIAEVLREEDYDVLCLQKVFDPAARAVLERALAPRYRHRFGPANDSCSPLLNSGVWVLSKVPLFGHREIQFDECGEIECLSRKGGILLFGACGGTSFGLIATHLQGEEGDAYTVLNDRVRAKQMEALRDRFLLPYAASSMPFIICGDLNTPRFTRMFHRESPNYTAMLRRFGAENGRDERITLDDTEANQLAIDKTGRKSEMDYVLVHRAGSALVVERERRIFRRGGWDDSARNRVDLSYRYAVGAKITFGTSPEAPAGG
jgi:endonuclease/exonuclease/phosphatase family metal-dependent hydrolase